MHLFLQRMEAGEDGEELQEECSKVGKGQSPGLSVLSAASANPWAERIAEATDTGTWVTAPSSF